MLCLGLLMTGRGKGVTFFLSLGHKNKKKIFILNHTIWTVVYVELQISFIRTTDSFIKDRLWCWYNTPDVKLVIIARQVVLLTRMAKFSVVQ